MRKRRTNRYSMPKIDLPQIQLPKVDLPQVDLPKPHLPKIHIPWKQVGLGLGLVVLALTMMNLNTRLSDYARLTGERDRLSVEISSLKATKAALDDQLTYAQSDTAVEEFARDAHMVRDGEKLVVVLTPSSNTVAATPAPAEEKASVPQPWQIWWALFFRQ